MKSKRMPRMLISLLGVVFILWGTMSVALGVFGEETTAYVTDIRREGGERSDGKPGRYTYITSYTFTSLNGKKIDGFARNIRDGAYVKADGTSTVRIRYFNSFPYFNAMENDTGLRGGPLILILVGGVLILLMAPKHGTGP
ncbi:hypothetical protein KCG48_11405 [Proteiniclasticum sp. BAD-10]|uniref:DUF3592 domain-containing protein n=1 Tax=Proteiniclasticum sediminis TaxID=2804028 RepID=A0A941CQM3_9CLOT|nr:hypothetical protein [Proteiniclasticum sediminis]MBR0576922.1 hypothetical protein [Proteiniclasticum sediminis]